MKSVSETRFLTLFGGERLDWLQIEVEIQMQVIQILSMNQEIQHVVTLQGKEEGGFHAF